MHEGALDAVAVALITPGPVVITVAFIGYLVAGIAGASAAAAGVFAPVYVITLFLAPHFQRIQSIPRVRDLVDGVTAAALARHVDDTDPLAAMLAYIFFKNGAAAAK